MKTEDLEKIETTNEIKEILSASKSLYKKELNNHPPRSFDSLMDQIAQREKPTIQWKISPWWMIAACTIGLLIGWTFPFTKTELGEKLAANDTIYITHKQVDTLFQQASVHLNEPVVKQRVHRSKTMNEQLPPQKVERITELPIPAVQKPITVSVGRSISQEEIPTHLYVCL